MSRHLPIDPGMTCLNTAKCRNVTHEIQVPVPWTLHLVKPRLQSGHFPILFWPFLSVDASVQCYAPLSPLSMCLSRLCRSSVQRIKNLAHRWSSGSHSDAPFCNYCRFCRDINDMSRHLPVLLKVTYVTCLMSCLDICLHVHDMWHRHLPIKKRFVRKTQ